MANDFSGCVQSNPAAISADTAPGDEAAKAAQAEHDRLHHGDDDTAGQPAVPVESFNPSVVPALVAQPEPNAPTPPEVTKDSSADARQADSVPVIGWVDHDIPSVTGEVMHVHSPGLVLIRHYKGDDKAE